MRTTTLFGRAISDQRLDFSRHAYLLLSHASISAINDAGQLCSATARPDIFPNK
jgi:hypothetical protein